MDRQFVHLSKEKETAYKVGKKRYPEPVILKIDAGKASKSGIDFFDRGEVVLSGKIPPEFIEPLE